MDKPKHNPAEAPPGYRAVPKASLPQTGENICRQCDFRPTCQAGTVDFHLPRNRCMAYEVVKPDGSLVARRDGVSVVFKRLPDAGRDD